MVWWCISLIATLACSSEDPPSGGNGDNAVGGLLSDDELPGGVSEGDDQRAQCLGETRQAEAIGLDMYVMLDISASMLDVLPQSSPLDIAPTKWDAVRTSLQSFIQAPETTEIGIGIQYFPQVQADVPFSCSANTECGAGGPCSNSYCVADDSLNIPNDGLPAVPFVRQAGDNRSFCLADGDCPGQNERCETVVGECVIPPNTVQANPAGAFINISATPQTTLVSPLCSTQADCAAIADSVCAPIGVCQNQTVLCSAALGCPAGAGDCQPFPYSCVNQTRCEVSEYATPAVPISSAVDRSAILVQSLQSQRPSGLTPTGPALRGALEHARTWAAENPARQVVTVLATDGFPTECTPLDIPDIAQIASDAYVAARPVRTFVIGVFSSGDLGADGQEGLDTLARAGGTDRAVVVNTGGNVAENFLNALNLIRDTAVSCEFKLDASAGLDYARVNLQVSDANSAARDLFNVGDLSACGADEGWYYVRDDVGNPVQINVCPSTCASFMAGGIRADLQIGCATRIK